MNFQYPTEYLRGLSDLKCGTRQNVVSDGHNLDEIYLERKASQAKLLFVHRVAVNETKT